MKRSRKMADGKKIVVDARGRPLDGWYCTQCETKVEDKVADSYPNSISSMYKNVLCHKCKKVKVFKLWRQS